MPGTLTIIFYFSDAAIELYILLMHITKIPILVIGTKLDLAEEVRIPQFNRRPSPIAEECGAHEIFVVMFSPFIIVL